MIITCPACSTRYLIDPRALGVTGRTVRCTQCQHIWAQLPAEDAPRRVDLPPPDAMAPPPPPRAIPPPAPAAMQTIVPPPAPPPPRRRSIVGPLATVLIVLIALGVLWNQRALVVAYVPQTASIYAALGVAVGDPRADLEFRKIASSREDANGHSKLIIQGEVANISALSRDVPRLRVTLQDANKKPLKTWTLTATRDRLAPGATVAFKTSIDDPSDDTVGAIVTFDNASN